MFFLHPVAIVRKYKIQIPEDGPEGPKQVAIK
jgi:hypothetical protein